jgi:linoleoyl-CoA desaturase
MTEGVTIKYQNDAADSLFFAGLKKKVKDHFLASGKATYGNKFTIIKTIVFFILFLGSYGLLLSNWFSPTGTLLLGIVCGLSTVLIVFNISHDASHNCLFRNRRLNKLSTYSLYLVGGNAYMWDITHNKIHHTYPNVADADPDIYQAAPFIRVSPSAPFKNCHRFQHLYAPILYLTHSLYLIFLKDFQDFSLLPKKEFSLKGYRHPTSSYVLLFLSKLFYLFFSLIIPLLVLDISWWKIILGYLLIHVFMSLLLSAVLIPVHLVDGNAFPQACRDQKLEQSWVRSIFENTIDYSYRSRLANFFFGGLNTHLAHHLFPQICHVHLIEVTDIIKREALQHGIPYRDLSMWGAIKAHFRLLSKMSKPTTKPALWK